jgi:hypothetical protein
MRTASRFDILGVVALIDRKQVHQLLKQLTVERHPSDARVMATLEKEARLAELDAQMTRLSARKSR